MLMSVKQNMKKVLSYLGFEIINKKLIEQAEDPYFVLSKILSNYDVETIIDAGASIGSTSLNFAKLFPQACVHAVEPYPPFYKKLSELTKIKKQVKPHQLAFAEKSGNKFLNINRSEGTNSLLDCHPDSSKVFSDLLEKKGQIKVATETIDNFIESQLIDRVDILKLDLQGYELFAIEGCTKSLNLGKIKIILCEIIFDKLYKTQPFGSKLLDKLISGYDFKFYNLYQPHYHHGQLIQIDALLLHSSIIHNVKSSIINNFHPYSKFIK